MLTVMRRIEPEEHIDRWYMVLVQPSLFEPLAVICAWGSRQNSYQQVRVLPAVSEAEALALAHKIVSRKVRRGPASPAGRRKG